MKRKGEGAYKGTHWMQKPENAEKMMARVRAMQRGAKKARKAGTYKKPRAEKVIEKILRRKKYPATFIGKTQDTVLHINGWKIALSKNEIRIDHE